MEALIRYNFNGDGPVCMLVYTTLELPLTATSLQRPLKRVPNCQNNLSKTVSDWRKWNGHEIWSVRRVDD